MSYHNKEVRIDLGVRDNSLRRGSAFSTTSTSSGIDSSDTRYLNLTSSTSNKDHTIVTLDGSGDNSSNSNDNKTPTAGGNNKATKGISLNNEADANFVASVDTGENYYDLFRQTRSLYEFKTPSPSKRFQQPREVPRPVVLGAVDVFERFVQRGLYEVFSIVRFFFAIGITILTETLKLVVRGVVQPIIVGFITIVGSHLLQPVLVSFFNYILQPYLSFVNNVLAMIQQTLQPWFMMVGILLSKIAEVLRAVRLVEVNMAPSSSSPNAHQPHQPQQGSHHPTPQQQQQQH